MKIRGSLITVTVLASVGPLACGEDAQQPGVVTETNGDSKDGSVSPGGGRDAGSETTESHSDQPGEGADAAGTVAPDPSDPDDAGGITTSTTGATNDSQPGTEFGDGGTTDPESQQPPLPSCDDVLCLTCDGATPITDNILVDTIWAEGVCVLGADVTVEEGVTLTIANGVIVKSGRTRGYSQWPLTVKGTLNVVGGDKGVVFTSVWDDGRGGDTGAGGASTGAKNDWGGIRFEAGAKGELHNAAIYYANNAITTEGAEPALYDLKAEQNTAVISASVMDEVSVRRLTATENSWNGLMRRAGTITEDTTWDQHEIVHGFEGNILIAEDATLTIGQGMVLKSGQSRGYAQRPLTVEGVLNVLGTEDAPVTFTSFWDDAVGDTNGGAGTTGAANDWGGIVFNNGSAGTLNYAEVFFAGTAVWTSGASPILDHLRAEGNVNAVSAAVEDAVHVSKPEFTGNSWNGLMRRAGTIVNDTTWDQAEVVHGFDGNIFVAEDATLTIGAGVVLKSGQSRGYAQRPLTIEGTLNAEGTEEEPVVFTSFWDDTVGDTNGGTATVGARNDWGGIVFNSGASGTLNFAEVLFAGSGVWTNGAAPVLRHLRAEGNTNAISSGAQDPVVVEGPQFTGNLWNGLMRRTGTIVDDTTWNQAEVVHGFDGTITVAEDATLTIAKGVVIKSGQSRGYAQRPLTIEGTLRVEGTEEDPVIFTSFWDDSVREDNNGDGGSTGAKNDWGGIIFNNGSSGTIDFAEVYHAGTAISATSSSPVITNTRLEKNAKGLGASGDGAEPSITASCFIDNTAGASAASGAALDALGNFWGSATGPSGEGLEGVGESITSEIAAAPYLDSCPL